MQSLIYIGFDPRPVEVMSFAVARLSIRKRLNQPIPIRGLSLYELQVRGLYTRETEMRGAQLWDVISDAPMSTEFAISRFMVPHLAQSGWALFVDADVMARANLGELFREADPTKAVMVVKHDHQPRQPEKMDGQVQTSYPRKNWSSVCLWNCDHPSTKALTLDMINSKRGLSLHQFDWLDDSEIGELDPKWNWLVGYSDRRIVPGIVHFTEGVPAIPGYEGSSYADEWFRELLDWQRR